jgi:hypothetical protein
MAAVELEMIDGAFKQFLLLMLSAAPIPAPTFDGLPVGQLVKELEWGPVELGATPDGRPAPGHMLAAKVSVKIKHIKYRGMGGRHGGAGHITDATAWMLLGITGSVLSAGMSQIDVAGAPPQLFAVRQELWSQDLNFDDSVKILIGSVLRADGVVTLRLSTTGVDNLVAPPANRVNVAGNQVLVRVAGEAFAELLKNEMWKAMDPPPAGTRLEEPPRTVWETGHLPWATRPGRLSATARSRSRTLAPAGSSAPSTPPC